MGRKVFYSFHYDDDNWRVSQIRNMGVVDENIALADNDWEEIKKGGDKAIQSWIDSQIKGRSCTIVLVGRNTAGRKWVNYEIEKSWNEGKGVLGIRIHKLKDISGSQDTAGANPFSGFNVSGKNLSSIISLHDSIYFDSKDVYKYIKENIANWVENAIKIRDSYKI